jgi:hypothetical protein
MTEVLIRRFGTLIDISPDGRNPLDPGIVALLTPMLMYEHKTLLRGHERFGPDGQTRSIDIETKHMYGLEQGRLVTGFGFLTRIHQALTLHGIRVRYIDISPPKQAGVYEPDWENLARHITFRPRQEECLRAIVANECGIVNATMGFGKTFLFEALCHLYHRAKIDILVKPKDVVGRIVRRLSRTLPGIGQIGGGKKYRGERITVFTAGSAHLADSSADFLFADEAHMLMTGATAVEMGRAWRYSRNFGFTGTPKGRLDGADAQLEMFFGPEIFRLTYPEAVELGLVVPIHVRWLPIRSTVNPADGKVGVPKQRWGIWRNDFRNNLIANDVRTNFGSPDDQVLILVQSIEHAIHLWQFLPEFSLCYGSLDNEDIERYQRSRLLPANFRPTTPEVRENMRNAFETGQLRKVIATDVWSTGVDFERLQVLYRTDARESENLDAQGPGRVSRIHPESGKAVGYVVDCFDAFDKTFKRKSETRKRHYAALGWSQDWPSGRSQIANA